MDNLQFEQYCDSYEFNREEFKDYLDLQAKLMNIHLDHERSNGDMRDKNVIIAEWIGVHSQWFRYMWIVLRKGIK